MNKSILKFVLLGCGAISKKHVAAINNIDSAEVVGAYDANPAAAATFEKEYGIPVFSSPDEAIQTTDPNVISILTPSGLHAQNVLELMRFNKHFVVEKPLALNTQQIDEILEESQARKLGIFVCQQNRFNRPIQKLREALDKDRFGKLVLGTIRVRWTRTQKYYDQKSWRGTIALDGGVLANQASHHIDMLLWMMGEAQSVMAKKETRLAQIESDDTCAAIIKFKNEALGIIEATTATRPKDLEGSISILGEKGSVVIGGFFMNELITWEFSEHDPMDEGIFDNFGRNPSTFAWNHTELLKNITESILNGKSGLIDGLEGRKSVELINAIYNSAKTGKEIYL